MTKLSQISIRNRRAWSALALGALMASAMATPSRAGTCSSPFCVLHTFSGPDGSDPTGPLISDSAGNLYGTTEAGGAHDKGTIFKLDTSQTLTTLHSFRGTDGQQPTGALVRDTAGNLYGTTITGGTCQYGVIFKISRAGKYSVLHDFCDGFDGGAPGGLIIDKSGNLYGTAYQGGIYGDNEGYGTVFKLDPSGNFKTLYTFDGTSGIFPNAGLAFDADQKFLFGTTNTGSTYSQGSYFVVSTQGGLSGFVALGQEIDTFSPCQSFYYGNPHAGVTSSKGDFFFVAPAGPTPSSSCGVSNPVYGAQVLEAQFGQIVVVNTLSGGENGSCNTASCELSGLVLDSEGNMYGTSDSGGEYANGAVYGISWTGGSWLVYQFTGGTDGGNPKGDLLYSNGTLYGTTAAGGTGQGVIFSIAAAN